MPFLIIFNLFFGWMFLNPWQWLLLGLILIVFFLLNFFILAKKVTRQLHRKDKVIDVEAEVLDNKDKLPNNHEL